MERAYLLLREIVFSHWWLPTRKQMMEISSRYGYRVKMVSPSFFRRHQFINTRLIGECRYRERVLLISCQQPKVFWHELGHTIAINLFRGVGFPEKIHWVLNELAATILGYCLNIKWWLILSPHAAGRNGSKRL